MEGHLDRATGSHRRSGLHCKKNIWTLPFTGGVLFCFGDANIFAHTALSVQNEKPPEVLKPRGVFTFY